MLIERVASKTAASDFENRLLAIGWHYDGEDSLYP